MHLLNKVVLFISCIIIAGETTALIYFQVDVAYWLQHYFWVVFLPFVKILIKRFLALNFISLLKAISLLFWHLSKLALLKILKTLGLRYGLYFSQKKWYLIRKCKVIFLRKGKQFFRKLVDFWSQYKKLSQVIIFVAFFPVVLTLFLLGLSFNVTRKTLVQKTQEAAMLKIANTASQQNKGIRAFIKKMDRKTLNKLKASAAEPKTNE